MRTIKQEFKQIGIFNVCGITLSHSHQTEKSRFFYWYKNMSSKQNGYIVYRHVSPSNKSYIGITKNYKKRCADHQREDSDCVVFKNAIKKYGWDNFEHHILFEGLTIEEAKTKEKELIIKYSSQVPNGYNLMSGGQGSSHSMETRMKLSKINKERGIKPPRVPPSKEYLEKLSLKKELKNLVKEEFQEKCDYFYPQKTYPPRPIPDEIKSYVPRIIHNSNYIRKPVIRITEEEKQRRAIVHRINVLKVKIERLGTPRNLSDESIARLNERKEKAKLKNTINKESKKLSDKTIKSNELKKQKTILRNEEKRKNEINCKKQEWEQEIFELQLKLEVLVLRNENEN